MEDAYLKPTDAARRLGISVTTFYDWLGQSDYGLLEIRGERVRIDYLQGGAKGQGRIRIATSEVERIVELMRVQPKHLPERRPPVQRAAFPGITVPLGKPREA
ncbi:hypothetical protein ETAA8_23250 [Anatilimnocola aggregata]|uniref:Helix-turn-helix domain-containing protein n=1 Tax=Anatilimnocola aggregata TaxID=2528021 RepID=A0A517YAI5_9BACT|nr:helix-turn-helix domain-containing protein [Anatilimnocola aggregata]QDU27238.1 hypothetical protein ETAA8_23250 [Anatilimnocola aggregata]